MGILQLRESSATRKWRLILRATDAAHGMQGGIPNREASAHRVPSLQKAIQLYMK
jgi:hypothetical protein